MKILTLWQPWATLMAIEAKTFETRHWPTKYRGPLGIHAGAMVDKEAILIPEIQAALGAAGYTKVEELPTKAVLCVVDVLACYSTNENHHPDIMARIERERAFGNYSYDRFAWATQMVKRFKMPIPARGAQGLFELPIDWRNAA